MMEEHGHETIERETIFEGKVVRLYLDKVLLPTGKEAEREVVLHWGAVGMVALDDEEKVYLVRQYRHPVGEELIEIPAGKLSPGEEPLDSLTQLRGRRVSIGESGSGTNQLARLLLEDFVLTDEDMTFMEWSTSDSVAALRNDDLDAAIIVASILSPVF